MPELVAFRFNPGPDHMIRYTEIIRDPVQSKFGLTKAQLFSAYKCKEYGVNRFGLHTMVVSNSLDVLDLAETVRMMFQVAVEINKETGISREFVNMGGGICVNYRPEQKPIDLEDFGLRVKVLYEDTVLPHRDVHRLQIKYECGTLVTGDYGWLISRVINMKDTYKRYLGVDATMADLLLEAGPWDYREITIVKDQSPSSDVQVNLPDYKTVVDDPSYAAPNFQGNKIERMFDVVDSICYKKYKFAVDRVLSVNPEIGDLCIFHSTGAYSGTATGYNFNAKLHHAEILRVGCNRFEMIRRAETFDDYFKTMIFP